jgi:hypothetical protein
MRCNPVIQFSISNSNKEMTEVSKLSAQILYIALLYKKKLIEICKCITIKKTPMPDKRVNITILHIRAINICAGMG